MSTALPEPDDDQRATAGDEPSPGAPTTRTADGPGGAAAGALGPAAPVPAHGWRDRLRTKPGLGQVYRLGVFLAGLVCVVLGGVLSVFPGPLTIPPVLLGLWIWSTEFRWARRLFEAFQRKAHVAWDHAKAHPVSSGLVTVGGLVGAAAAFWAAQHFDLVSRAREAVGL